MEEQERFLQKIKIQNPKYINFLEEDIPVISLKKLYAKDYWITEFFGTEAVVVWRHYKHFDCAFCKIDFNQYENECKEFVSKIAKEKYNYWKRYLTYYKKKTIL